MKHLKFTLLLVGLISLLKVSAYNARIDGIYYNFSGSNAIVTYLYYNRYENADAYNGNIIIPESVTYQEKTYKVTSIGRWAFRYCNITSISIPNSVTSIENSAFESCTLKYISLPNSITRIQGSTFKGCSLTSITIPNSVVSIEVGAFQDCYNLLSITIPNSVTSIGDYAFYNCDNLLSITIPNSVTSIGNNAFADCDNLKSFIIGSGVYKINGDVFSGHLPSKVIWLSNNPPIGYQYAEGITNYVTNDQYSELNNKKVYPFLNSIFDFEGIIYVPISPSEKKCEAIDCTYDSNVTNLTIKKNVSYKGIEMTIDSIMPYVCCGNPYIKNIKWDFGEIIPKYAFEQCEKLLSVIIGDNTKSISNNAFSGCKLLQNINLGKGILTIGDKAFEKCSSIKHIDIPANVVWLKGNTFEKCSKLVSVNFEEPNKEDMYRRVFDDIESNGYSSKSQKYEIDVKADDLLSFDYNYIGGLDYGTNTRLSVFANDKKLLEINVNINGYNAKGHYFYKFSDDEHVVLNFKIYSTTSSKHQGKIFNIEVGNDNSICLSDNFKNCPIESIYLGRYINYDQSPFYKNTYLKSINITKRETKISNNEFFGCTNLNKIILGNNITDIGNSAFNGCISLEEFVIGSNMKHIGESAFSGCLGLKRFITHAITPPICDYNALVDIDKWNCTLSVPEGSTAAYQQAEQWKDFFFINNDLTGISKISNDHFIPTNIYDINGRKINNAKPGLNIIHMNDGTTKKVVVK